MNDRQLVKLMREHAIVLPRITLQEARRAGLELAVAWRRAGARVPRGENVFGHDPTIFAGGGAALDRFVALPRV